MRSAYIFSSYMGWRSIRTRMNKQESKVSKNGNSSLAIFLNHPQFYLQQIDILLNYNTQDYYVLFLWDTV